jgi:hypothetical protein
MTLSRITRAESWTAAGTSLSREKTAVGRHQAVGAFGRDLALASEWHCPADAVAQRIANTLDESYGLTTAASLVREFGHVVLAVTATAEADRTKDAAIAFVDLIHATTGGRAFMACGFREPIEAVDGYVTERITTVNLSYIIRTVRAVAARNGLVGFNAPFMYAPTSTEYAVVMAPYAEAITSDIVEESSIRKAEALARRVGAEARRIAMGGSTSLGRRATLAMVLWMFLVLVLIVLHGSLFKPPPTPPSATGRPTPAGAPACRANARYWGSRQTASPRRASRSPSTPDESRRW